MYLNRKKLSQKCYANVYTQNLACLTPGKVWVNANNELQCILGFEKEVLIT
jgi:hypothetical protein